MYYTVIKHDGHLRTRGKCRKHEPQSSVFYISQVFSNVRSILSQCNARIRLLHLLYDIQGAIYVIKNYKLTVVVTALIYELLFGICSSCYGYLK